MGRKKVKPEEEPFDVSAYYDSIQLTPEQKAGLRAELWERIQEARRNGVYENIRALRGKVHLDMDDVLEVRKDKR